MRPKFQTPSEHDLSPPSGPNSLISPNKFQKTKDLDCDHESTTIECDTVELTSTSYEADIEKVKSIAGIIRQLRGKNDYPATANQLESAYDCAGTLIDDLFQANYDLRVKLNKTIAHNDKLTEENERLKSSRTLPGETLQQHENSTELAAIVLDNSRRKTYAELLKSTKQHFRNMNLPKESVDHVRPGPKGKTIVVCTSEIDKVKILESLKTQVDLGAREAKERRRTLMVKNVPTSVKDTDFIKEISENDDRFSAEKLELVRSFKVGGGDP